MGIKTKKKISKMGQNASVVLMPGRGIYLSKIAHDREFFVVSIMQDANN
jgi:hypothetical protein